MQRTFSDKITIGVLTNAFREEKLIQGCILQFPSLESELNDGETFSKFNFSGFGEAHIILNSKFSWGYDRRDIEQAVTVDNTAAIAEALGAKVIRKHWETEAQQFNEGLAHLEEQGCDWALIVDADERYTQNDLLNLFINLNVFKDSSIQSFKPLHWSVYWKTPDYKLIPDQSHKPIIAIRPSERFVKGRIADCSYSFAPVELHHFSYVRDDEEIQRKIHALSRKREIVPHWYEEKWLNWNPKTKDLHPVVPSQFNQAVYDPCPDELRPYLP